MANDAANRIAPGISPKLENFILKSRQVMGDPRAIPALVAAIHHAKNVPQAIAMFLMGVIHKSEQAMHPIDAGELRLALGHLAGTVIEVVDSAIKTDAKTMPPAVIEMAKDKKKFWQAILFQALQIEAHVQQQAQQAPPDDGPGAPPDAQGAPEGPQDAAQDQPPQPLPPPPDSVLGAMRGQLPSKQLGSVNFLEAPSDDKRQ